MKKTLFKEINKYPASFFMIGIWSSLFLINYLINIADVLCGKGIGIIGYDYYRFATATFIHFNIIQLIANIVALYWIGVFLEQQLSFKEFIVFGILVSTITQISFSCIYSKSYSFGGSPFVFGMIGLIVSLQLFCNDFQRFKLGTWYGNWIVAYCILGNVPFLRLINPTTIVIHILALGIGFIMGIIYIINIRIKIRKSFKKRKV